MVRVPYIAAFLLVFHTILVHSQIAPPDPKIVILGATGVGKSSLANVFIGASPDCTNCTFPICPGGDSCTKTTTYAAGNWLGTGEVFTVVDTPGFGDTDNEDSDLIDEMIDILKNNISTTNTFLLTFNGMAERVDTNIQQMIREMEALFGHGFWNNTALGVTHWAYDAKSVSDREYSGKDEKWYTDMMNSELQEMFHLDKSLSAVFIDSWAKMPQNLDDQDQQAAFGRESEKLWTLTNQFEPFAFKTIEDILKELDECQRTVDDDIAELKEQMRVAQSDIQELNATDQKLNATDQELKAADEILVTDVEEIHQEIDDISAMPLGSIIAWVLKPMKDAKYTAVLPDGWTRCDGISIPSPSPWAGKFTPDLNGERRFLRGGPEISYLDVEEDQIQDLNLIITDNGHAHTDKGHTHHYDDKTLRQSSSSKADCNGSCDEVHIEHFSSSSDQQRTTASGKTDIQSSLSNVKLTVADYRRGEETRPKNVHVIWIMRIY